MTALGSVIIQTGGVSRVTSTGSMTQNCSGSGTPRVGGAAAPPPKAQVPGTESMSLQLRSPSGPLFASNGSALAATGNNVSPPPLPYNNQRSGLAALSGPLPVPAYKYKADKSDMIDMAMSWALCKLDATSSASLWLRRLERGRYEIDGRRVTVDWRNQKRTDLLAREDDVQEAAQMALVDYLRQAAGVASSLATPQIPALSGRNRSQSQSTFVVTQEFTVAAAWEESSYVDEEGDPRIASMKLACKQAGAVRESMRETL